MPWWKRLPFFYGWLLVGVVFTCFAVGYATFHSFSIFFVAIIEEFGWSRAVTATAFSVFTLVYGISVGVSGALVDRFGPRVVFPCGAIILGIGLILTTRITTVWQFGLIFGFIVAIGLAGFGSVPSYTVLNNWFAKKRGTALGFATAGIGVGTLIMVPLLQVIISNHGWRTAYIVLAIVIMVVVPTLAIVFQRYRPQDMGLLPDGDKQTGKPLLSRAEQARADVLVVDKDWASREWTLAAALRTRRFWLILTARGVELTVLQLFLTHQAAIFVDTGYEKLVAASVVGVVGIVGSIGKIFWGTVSDRIGRELTYTFAYLFGTVGIVILMLIKPGSPVWMLYAYALAYGICYAASAFLIPVLMADVFHGKHFGSVLGGIYVGGGIGMALGSFLGGYIYDVTGSYNIAFYFAIPAMWIACLLIWLAAPRKVRLVAGKRKAIARLQAEG